MWPSLDRYNASIHKPDTCFDNRELSVGWPMRDKRGLPAPATGSFGCVYHIHTWESSWAVKCFTREVLIGEWRYTEISAYIEAHPAPCLVKCKYLVPRGIMVDGHWYPVLKMDWVEGQTLDRFIEAHLTEPAVMQELVDSWLTMMRALEERRMAHGDLQHGNILICKEGNRFDLKLVDYDGMYVPSFEGEEGSESGLVDYQHPHRTGRDFNERMDHFTGLLIYISLLALVRRPELWARYHTSENLIFQRKDFERPDASQVIAELRQLGDPVLSPLLDRLSAACLDEDPCSLPALHSVVTGEPELHPAPQRDSAAARTHGSGLAVAATAVAPRPAGGIVIAPLMPPAPPADAPDVMMLACPTCGVRNRAIARYCRGCGLALPYTALPNGAPLPLPTPASRICPWCGLENERSARWCVSCTALLD